jgi:hypothetical protein
MLSVNWSRPVLWRVTLGCLPMFIKDVCSIKNCLSCQRTWVKNWHASRP